MEEKDEVSEIKDSASQIRQGDILLFKNNDDSSKYGIVVTGDCDIVQKKCREIITYCVITSVKYFIFHEFLKDNCIDKELNKLKESIIKKSCAILKNKKSNSLFDNILDKLPKELESVFDDKNLIKKILVYKEFSTKASFSFSDYEEVLKVNDCEKIDEEIQRSKKKLESKLNTLPGDKFFISELPGQNDNYGYIVHLRLINSVRQDEIEKKFDKAIYRIGHLNAPFLYRLTQQLGSVFSDIGLPGDYENNRNTITKFILENVK